MSAFASDEALRKGALQSSTIAPDELWMRLATAQSELIDMLIPSLSLQICGSWSISDAKNAAVANCINVTSTIRRIAFIFTDLHRTF